MFGRERGFCLMIGGADAAWPGSRRCSRASPPASMPRHGPAAGAASRRPAEEGYLHCGPNGAGHFVKMVHNGIEYGLMAAYAEGLNILAHADDGTRGPRRRRRDRAAPRRRSSTTTTSTRPRSPRCGAAGAWSRRGCSTSPRRRSAPTPGSTGSAAACPTRARGGGRCRRPMDEGVPADVLSRRAVLSGSPRSGQADFAQPGPVGHAQGVRRPRREAGSRKGTRVTLKPPEPQAIVSSARRATSPSASCCPRSSTCTPRAAAARVRPRRLRAARR